MELNLEFPENAFVPMVFNPVPHTTVSKSLQPLKASEPMTETLFGSVRDFKLTQLKKEKFPIEVIHSPMDTEVIIAQ